MKIVRQTIRLAVWAWLLSAAALARAEGPGGASILHLSNGDRLSGREVRVDDGRLFWQLQDGPEIAIPLAAVWRIERQASPAAPPADPGWTSRHATSVSDSTNGSANASDRASGDATPAVKGDAATAAEPADREEGTILPASLLQPETPFVGPPAPGQAFLPPPGIRLRPVEDPDAIDETDSYFASAWNAIRVRSANFYDGFTDWTEQIEFGGRTLSGNTEEDYITAGAKFARTTLEQSSLLEFGGQWSQSDGQARSNRWWGNGTVDYNKKGNWLFFMTTKNEYDEFENLAWRGTLAAGPGYRVVNEPERRFILRAGPAVTREIYNNPDRDRATADILGEFEVLAPVFWDRLVWEHKTTAIPSVEDFEIIRITTASGLSLKLDNDARWHVKLGFRHEYNSQPNPDRLRSDYTTSLFLVYRRQ
ncbi:MAG: DUF481 domain-containing protein [Planctomycetales bacterium]